MANSHVASLPVMIAPACAKGDGEGIFGRDMVLEQGGMAGRADAGGVVDVLQPDRDAMQRAFPVAACNLGLSLPCIGAEPALPATADDCCSVPSIRSDAVEKCVESIRQGTISLSLIRAAACRDGQEMQIGHQERLRLLPMQRHGSKTETNFSAAADFRSGVTAEGQQQTICVASGLVVGWMLHCYSIFQPRSRRSTGVSVQRLPFWFRHVRAKSQAFQHPPCRQREVQRQRLVHAVEAQIPPVRRRRQACRRHDRPPPPGSAR